MGWGLAYQGKPRDKDQRHAHHVDSDIDGIVVIGTVLNGEEEHGSAMRTGRDLGGEREEGGVARAGPRRETTHKDELLLEIERHVGRLSECS